MSDTLADEPLGIAEQAEFETWRNVRRDIRHRLIVSVTVAFVYLIAALAVGGYLVLTVRGICQSSVFLEDWEPVQYDVDWMTQIAWGYGAAAMIATIFFPCVLLLIQGKLPSGLNRFLSQMPWIGSTTRIVSLADFFESMYRSVLQSQTYSQAMATASKEVRDSDLRRWSAESASRIDAGQSLTSVMKLSPFRESPISAMSAFVSSSMTADQTRRVWHHATAECHALAASRMKRTTQFLSVSCLLVCVLLASFAMLISAIFLSVGLKGLAYGNFFWGLM